MDYDDLGSSGNYLKKVTLDILQPQQKERKIKQSNAKRDQVNRKKKRQQYLPGLKSWIRPQSQEQIKQQQKQSDDNKMNILPLIAKLARKESDNNKQYKQMISYESQKIYQIIRYIFDQFATQKKQLLKPLALFYQWQLQQLKQTFQDSNLGDFIIKLPNPDNLPKEYLKVYEKLQKQDNQYFNIEQARQIYNQMFDLQQKASIYQSNLQKMAFNVCFYLLNIKQRYQKKQIQQQVQQANMILQNNLYYKKIRNLQLKQYMKIKQTPQMIQQQKGLMTSIRSIIKSIQRDCIDIQEQNQHVHQIFRNHVTDIQKVILDQVQQCYQDIGGKKATALLIQSPSIVSFFQDFPKFGNTIIKKAIILDETQQRKICKGQYLVKSIVDNELVWQVKNRRPQDLLTLFRKFMLYVLTQRGKLFVRSFLAKNQQQFFIVLKSSEQVMQEYAQNNQMKLQVQLGSTDLFSFQPVDSFLRPLRVNPYIRDRSFKMKYDLDFDKKDKDQSLGQLSIESEALTFYRKSQAMNRQQLRAKIILDQEEADDCYNWLSKKLGLSYLKHDEVIFNKYNDEVIDEDIWQIYYVYNKFIIEYVKRVRKMIKLSDPKSNFLTVVNNNLGLLLRLMFLKALQICNKLYYNQRQERGIFPRSLVNIFKSKKNLRTIWDSFNVDLPKGFWPYIKIQKLQRIWKKYQINQLKNRSKFFPAERLILTNEVIRSTINISKSLTEKHMIDYFAIHDPFLLKNIKLNPYINVFKNIVFEQKIGNDGSFKHDQGANTLFEQYASEYTKLDFTKQSIQQKLQGKFGKLSQFSIETVRYYCGTKLAFYFQYMKFLSTSATPFYLIALIFQIVFWVQTSQILATGTSSIKNQVNILIIITTFLNIVWIIINVEKWRTTQKQLSQSYGLSQRNTGEQLKRIQFEGSFKRNFQNDQMNFEYVPAWKKVLTAIFTFLINIIFVALMGMTIIQIFVLKVYLYQSGQDPTIVNQFPAVLMSVAIKVFNFLYNKLIFTILQFENHKTINQYQASMVSKSYSITFIVTFNSTIIFGYFARYLDGDFICLLKSQSGQQFIDCNYFMINQLQTYIIIDLVMTFVGAFIPYITFKVTQYLKGNPQSTAKFNQNPFEPIDQCYEEQDRMSSYLYDDVLDKSWMGYIKFISVWTAIALFGNALPLTYVALYLKGLIGMHAGKFQIIYLSKRSIPMNTAQSSHWLLIMQIISVIGILFNLGYLIYLRKVFTQNEGIIFFFLTVIIFIFKYFLIINTNYKVNQMSQRNRVKTFNIINDKGLEHSQNKPQPIDIDISNVIYDEERLQRKFPKFAGANLKIRAKKTKNK